MTLRVYLKDNDGKTSFIDYGINTENYQSVIKVELYLESSKLKSWMGSKYVGISSIDTPQKQKTSLKNYDVFDLDKHDTDTEFYLASALCSNCNNTTQIAIKKGDKLQSKKLYTIACSKCTLLKTLRFAKWNGHEYKVIKK